jgi:hypothetical protein
MPINEYQSSSAVQLKLLAYLVRKPNEALGVVEPSYFTNPVYVDIARIVKKAFQDKNLKADRLTEVALQALVDEDLPKSRGREVRSHCRRVIRDLFDDDLRDRKYLGDIALEFSKSERYRQALVEAERDVNARNYDSPLKRFMDLQTAYTPNDGSIKLPFQPLHRFIEHADESESVDEFIVYPIIPKRGGVLLYGLPKELKSWMGAALAMDVAAGRPKALGFFRIPRAARTLYVQIEDTAAITRNRVNDLYKNQIGNSSKTTLNLRILPRHPLNLMDPQSLAAFEREIAKFKPEFIVLDVFRRLFRGNVLDSKDTAEFLQILDTLRDRYGCAIVLVHHAKKGETHEIQSKALGSVNLTAWADVLIFLYGKRQMGKSSVSNIQIDSKAAIAEDQQLVIRVDDTKYPMVCVLDQERCDMNVLRACVREKPGLNQKELVAKSGFGEKKLRPLLERAIERGLLRKKHGNRKTLCYFLPKPR